MAGAWTTLSIKDASGASQTMRVWDESGAGTGPFSFGQMASDGAGGGGEPALNSSIAAKGTDGSPSADFVSVQPKWANRSKRGRQYTQITNTAETTIITAVASTFLDLSSIMIWNAGTTSVNATLRDGTGGTVTHIIYCPAGAPAGFRLDPSDPLNQTTQNTNWTLQADGSTTLNVTARYIKN